MPFLGSSAMLRDVIMCSFDKFATFIYIYLHVLNLIKGASGSDQLPPMLIIFYFISQLSQICLFFLFCDTGINFFSNFIHNKKSSIPSTATLNSTPIVFVFFVCFFRGAGAP